MSKWNVALVSIVKNEVPYIEEWILHHLALGVEHFFIYDNGSDDGTPARLIKFINAGVATLINWPMRGGQTDAYNHALILLRGNARWVGFLDIDEFVVLHEQQDLVAFLDGSEADQVLIPWRNFTYGGHANAPGGGTTENYFWAYRPNGDTPVQVKHFVRPEATERVAVHCSITPGARIKLADGRQGAQTHAIRGPTYRGAQINHYSTRSHAENIERLKKGMVSGRAFKRPEEFHPLTQELANRLDYDDSILRHRAQYALKERYWQDVPDRPHRFGLRQVNPVLPSYNDVLYQFCTSFGNHVTRENELRPITSFRFMRPEPNGGSTDISAWLPGNSGPSLLFAVDAEGISRYFQGTIHYGDFARRYDLRCIAVAREEPAASNWQLEAPAEAGGLFAYYDITASAPTEVSLLHTEDHTMVGSESVPAGRFVGVFYVPTNPGGSVRLTITGKATCREIVLGSLP